MTHKKIIESCIGIALKYKDWLYVLISITLNNSHQATDKHSETVYCYPNFGP
jgi:hypothetical protein